MNDTQLRRMDEIEGYRQLAYSLSRTDRLGLLLTKSLDLQQTVVRDGPSAEYLSTEVELLRKERIKIMSNDPNKDELMRALIYGVIASNCIMIESIIERFEERGLQPHYDLLAMVKDDAMYGADPSESSLVLKEEPEDMFDELPRAPSVEGDDTNPEAIDILPRPPQNYQTPSHSRNNAATKRTIDESYAEGSEEPELSRSMRKRRRSSIPEKGGADDDASVISSATSTSSIDFKCNQCGKQFHTGQALKCHLNSHNGVHCGECGMSIKNEENLLKHYANVHPGKQISMEKKEKKVDWPQKCPVCGMKFKYHSHYKAHMLIHTGEKPFECSTCSASFRAQSALNQHLRDAHGEKPYNCEQCGESFDLRTELFHHNKNAECASRNVEEINEEP